MQHLLVVSSINEVSSGIIERVEELETRLLVHHAHSELLPLVTDTHGAETEWRDVYARKRPELAVSAKFCWWRWGRGVEWLGHCPRPEVRTA